MPFCSKRANGSIKALLKEKDAARLLFALIRGLVLPCPEKITLTCLWHPFWTSKLPTTITRRGPYWGVSIHMLKLRNYDILINDVENPVGFKNRMV